MERIIDVQFLRVEKALSTLIASIATYNPSLHLATDLLAADQELTRGLELLSRHQANHARIQSLRSTSSALDNQIKSTLTLLNDTRTELLATPATVFPENTNLVNYSELLSYARRISKFTMPPTFREADTDGATPEATNVAQNSEVKSETQIELHDSKANGTSTPVVTNGAIGGLNSGEAGTATPVDTENPTALPAVVSDWLNPLASSAAFVPWPTEETIRRGALASIQLLLDTGVDPATFDPERSAELEAERKRREEEAEALKAQQEAEKARLEQERREELQRRQSVGTSLMSGGPGSVKAEEKPAVFMGLELLDDMDEDED